MLTGAAGAALHGVENGVGARSDAGGPALRVPDPQAALRPLHPGDGRAGLRHAAGAVPGGLRGVDGELEPGATTALVYSVGWTQHSVGAQYIRAGAIIQLLLGNIGRPGRRGVRAARARQHPGLHGHPDAVQPAARLPADAQRGSHDDLASYLDTVRSHTQKGYWSAADAYMVSLLKEYFGEHATAENDFGFDLLPKISGDHGTYRQVMDMVDGGKIFGYFLLGPEPGGRLGARQAAAPGHGEPRLGGRPRPRHDRERDVLEGLAGDRDRRDRARRSAARRCSSSPPRRTSRRRARSPRRSGWCSGGTRPSSRPATSARTCGSSTTWAGWSRSGWRRRRTRATSRCRSSTGATTSRAIPATTWPEPSADDVLGGSTATTPRTGTAGQRLSSS